MSGAVPMELGRFLFCWKIKTINFGKMNVAYLSPKIDSLKNIGYHVLKNILFRMLFFILFEGGNDKLSGTIPSGIKNTIELQKSWGWDIELLWIDISKSTCFIIEFNALELNLKHNF